MQLPMDQLLQSISTTQPVLWWQIGTAAVIVAGVAIVWWLISRCLGKLREKGRLSEGSHFALRRILWWTVCVVAVLLLLQHFQVLENAWTTITALLAMVAIGFVAVWSVLSNSLCALILMMMRPFNVGDTIEITGDGLRGKVIDFNMIFTTLRDGEGSLLQVPNNLFFQKPFRRELGKKTVTLDKQADLEKPTE